VNLSDDDIRYHTAKIHTDVATLTVPPPDQDQVDPTSLRLKPRLQPKQRV